MLDPALDGLDRAEVGITGEAMAEGFPTSGVLLISVGKGDICPLLHIIPRTSTGRDPLEGWTAKHGVIKTEGLASATVSGGRQGIFPRAAEEVEGKGAQVKDGLGPQMVRGLGEGLNQGLKDHDVDGPDMGGSRVLISPSLEEGLEVKDVVGAFQPGISREAQSGKHLPHSMEGFLHALSTDGVRALGEQAMVVVAGKDDEELKVGVRRDITGVGILLERGGESHPGGKQMVSVSLGCNHDAVAGHLHCSKEIRAESITVRRQYMH